MSSNRACLFFIFKRQRPVCMGQLVGDMRVSEFQRPTLAVMCASEDLELRRTPQKKRCHARSVAVRWRQPIVECKRSRYRLQGASRGSRHVCVCLCTHCLLPRVNERE